ncbi:MAG: hypothetical protein ABSH56_14610, partial [Bryobacteraceae bacterium]
AKTTANIGSRKRAVSFGSIFIRLPVAAEGRFESLLHQFTLINSNRTPTCQWALPLLFQFFCGVVRREPRRR